MNKIMPMTDKSYAVPAVGGGIGAIFHNRIEKDKWDNDVSVIEMPDGRKYRLVHHTEPTKYRQKATLYGGRNLFVRIFTSTSDNDCVETKIEINNILVSWGDGDNLGVTKLEETWPKGEQHKRKTIEFKEDEAPLVNTLRQIPNDNFEQVILTTIFFLEGHPEKWQRKPEK